MVFMNKIESRAFLENLQIALTIVIGNDVIVPRVEQREAVFKNSFVYGYIWRYKNAGVKVDLGSICDAKILENNALDIYIEHTRTYVKGELCKMIEKEANK